jgi:hypothetical protein
MARTTPHAGADPMDEAYRRAFEDWKRVRSAIEFENTLIHYRQTWHAGLQLPLVAAFFVVFPAVTKPSGTLSTPVTLALLLLPLLGLAVALFIQTAIHAASRQIKVLEDWWFTTRSNGNRRDYLAEHPPINGLFDERIYKGLNPAFIPMLFVVAWAIALGASVYQITEADTLLTKYGSSLLIVYSLIVTTASLYHWFRRNKPASAGIP